MSKLKPCPFCGGEAEEYKSVQGQPPNLLFYGVGCSDCCVGTAFSLSKKIPTKQWNLRARPKKTGNRDKKVNDSAPKVDKKST